MQFADVVRRRRMVRSFDGRPLGASTVDRLLATMHRAPSAGYTQGTELLVLEGAEQTGRYWEACLPADRREAFAWPGLLRAPLLVVVLASRQAYVERYAEPDKGGAAGAALPGPVPYWHVDAAFGALLGLLAAVDAGLGAVFFAVREPAALAAEFGIPERFEPVGTVAVGHPADDRPSGSLARGRRPVGDVVHRGRW